MSERITAGAIVQVTVEVSRCGSWGPECTLEQVHRQAAADAVQYINQRCQKDNRLRVIGKPVVTAVSTSEHRS